MLTARAASRAIIINDISDCSIINIFAHLASTGTSVGEKAVLVLNARNRYSTKLGDHACCPQSRKDSSLIVICGNRKAPSVWPARLSR